MTDAERDGIVVVDNAKLPQWGSIKVTFEFSISPQADREAVAEAIFNMLCDGSDAPYMSCDGWEWPRDRTPVALNNRAGTSHDE